MFMKGLGIKGGGVQVGEEYSRSKNAEVLCRGFKILQSESYKK